MRRALLLPILLFACSDPPPLVTKIAPSGALWIAGARVVDVVTGTVTPSRDVRVADGRIAEIVPAGAAPAGAIDGSGAYLVPGLIDAHVHINTSSDPPWEGSIPDAARNLQGFLYAGVTTIFETGGLSPGSFERRDAVASGQLLGPRILTTGPIFTAKGGHPVPMIEDAAPALLEWYLVPRLTRQVASIEEASSAVDELLQYRPDAIKIVLDQIPEGVPELDGGLAKAIALRAREKGLRAVAHIGTTADALAAGEAGVSAWVHGVYKERVPDEAIEKLAAFHIPMVPTLVVFESYGAVGRGPREPTALEREIVPEKMLRSRDAIPADFHVFEGAKEYLDRVSTMGPAAIDNVRRLHAAGIVMLAGSDAQSFVPHGPSLHRELSLLAKALPPLEVLRAATLNAARFLSAQDDPPFGVVAPGKAADLLLVEGNPLEDVEALHRIRAVIAGGAQLERRAIAAR